MSATYDFAAGETVRICGGQEGTICDVEPVCGVYGDWYYTVRTVNGSILTVPETSIKGTVDA